MRALLLLALLIPVATPGVADLTAVEQRIVEHVAAHNEAALELLERAVEINSGTLNFAGVREVGRLFDAELSALGFATRWLDGAGFERAGHLVAERPAGTGEPGVRLLLIGHLDTVFEPDSPFQRWERLDPGRARGPGATDMKGGNVVMLRALAALGAVGALDSMHVTVVLTGDEEKSGRPLTLARQALREAAVGADAAIGFEDGDSNPETAVIARRGSTRWELRVHGVPAHSSQIFTEEIGAGAIYEASRILTEFYRRLSVEPDLTFSPGVILGGTDVDFDPAAGRGVAFGKDNVVAEHAVVSGDIRALSPAQYERAKATMLEIVGEHLPRTTAALTFSEGYPPLADTEGNRDLLALYDAASRDLGLGPVAAVDPRKAGAADVSFVADLVPHVLDGIGLMGSGGHTVEEIADLTTLPTQAQRAALLLYRLGSGGLANAEPEPDWAALALARLPGLELCRRPNIEEPLLCGTLEVPENRAKPSGRRLELNLVVVPAQSANPPQDPVFVFEGGPGGAVTRRAAGSTYAGPVRRRDIVLVDQRGTGDSHPLDCDLGAGSTAGPGELPEMFPPAAVAACAAALAADADLRFYTSVDHADDIEAVRRHLGYGPINLRGGSYGTRAIMVYALRYPESTRTLFGIGVDSPLRSNMSERGVWAERTLVGIAQLCASEPACATLGPDLFAEARALLEGLDDGPRRVEIADPMTLGERLTLDVSRDWLGEQLRLNLYFAFTSRALPWAVHRARAAGDWEPLAQLGVLIQRSFKSALSTGVVLAIQCAEHMDFDVEAALARGARTLFGNYRLEQQLQGCAAWPHTERPALGLENPLPLNVPSLWLSGAFDPVTPPAYAEDARTFFPNSRHLVLAQGQHGPFDLDESWMCVHGLWADLLDSADVDAVDASCTEAMLRPPFIVDGAAFATYLEEVLVPMSR
jgi:glutamate carboxypeptidase